MRVGDEGINIDIDPALIPSQYNVAGNALVAPVIPVTGAVASINNQAGPLINIVGSSNLGIAVVVSGAANTISVSISGNGSMATKSEVPTVAPCGVIASISYDPGELQAVANKVDELIATMQAAGHML